MERSLWYTPLVAELLRSTRGRLRIFFVRLPLTLRYVPLREVYHRLEEK